MSNAKKKTALLSQINAQKVVSTFKTTKNNYQSILDSIDDSEKILPFLYDTLIVLLGIDKVEKILLDVISDMEKLEVEIKQEILNMLREVYICDFNPIITNAFITNGLNIKPSSIDFFNYYALNPNDPLDSYFYFDAINKKQSDDINVYIRNVLSDKNITNDIWKDLLLSTFDNTNLNFKPTPKYLNKSLNIFNTDYINKITLFNIPNMTNKILNALHGNNIKGKLGKVLKIDDMAYCENITEKLQNESDSLIITDDYFQLTDIEREEIRQTTNDKRNGIIRYNLSKTNAQNINIDSNGYSIGIPTEYTIDIPTLKKMNITETTTDSKLIRDEFIISFNKLNGDIGDSVNDKDAVKKINILKMIKAISKTIAMQVFNPNIVLLIAIDSFIVNGGVPKDKDEFIKKNKNLIRSIVKMVQKKLEDRMIEVITKEINKLVANATMKIIAEKKQLYINQMKTLIGF